MANEAVHTLSVYSGQFLIASVLTVKNNETGKYETMEINQLKVKKV